MFTQKYLKKAFGLSIRWYLKAGQKLSKDKTAYGVFVKKCREVKGRLPNYTNAQIHRQVILMGIYCLVRQHELPGFPADYYPHHSRLYNDRLIEQKHKKQQASYSGYWQNVVNKENK